MSDTMCNALAYARLGWPVLPLCAPVFNEDGKPMVDREGRPACTHSQRGEQCGKEAKRSSPGKIPIGEYAPHGAASATTNEATVRGWFDAAHAKGHALNYGLAMGHGRFALDLDTYKHSDALDGLEAVTGKLPPTAEFHTGGGGKHLVFAVPDGATVNQAPPRAADGTVIKGIDVRSTGGYLVGPGSVHPSGAVYRAEVTSDPLDGVQPTLAPEALVRWLTAPSAPAAPLASPREAGERIPEGERKQAMVSLAGSLHARGSSEATVIAAVVAEDAERCDPPLGEKEATRIARTVTKKPRVGPTAPKRKREGVIALEYDAPYAEVVTADRFVRGHANELAYCHERGWFAYRETHWSHDELRPFKLAQDFARERAERALRDGADHRTVMTLLKNSTLRAVVDLSRAQLAVRQAAFDSDAWLFNCASGTIDLRTGEHRKHQHEDRCTKLSPVAFDPDAVCPRWDAFLERVLPDADVRAFVQRLAGLAMLGEQREHVLPVFYGRGANGKSTFLEAVQYVFGDYAKAVPSDVLMQREGEQHPTEKAQLLGLRLAVCSETKQGRSLDEGTMKSLTGGDRISARFMHRDFFEFTPTHSLVLATNHKPRIKGTDDGIWRRLLLVPWVVTVPVAERDTALGEKLRAEAPGILRWCVEGFRAWRAQGLAAPESVKLATKGYRSESDVLGRFIEERCVRLEVARVQASALHAAFAAWCAANGESAMTPAAFGRALSEEHGFEKTKSNTVFWLRLGLQAQSEAREPDGLGGLGGLGGFQETSHARAQESTGGKPSRPSHPPAAPVAVLPRPSANDTRKLAVGDYEPSGRRGEHL